MNLNDAIQEAKKTLGATAADIIASGLCLDKWDSRSLKGCCPVHSEKTPSFIWDKKHNLFKCFGCGASMDILDYYTGHRNMSFIEAAKELFRQTGVRYEFEDHEKQKEYRYPLEEQNTKRSKVEKYMSIRGISRTALDKRGVKEDLKGNIVFEYRNQYGELMLTKYRPARKVEKGENKTWCQKDKDTTPLLFGMDKVDTTKPLLITEGESDCLACIEAGFNNAVSVPFGANNYQWIEYNWEWLKQFDKIIVWADNDEAGDKMRAEVVPRLGNNRVMVVKSKHKDANIHLFKEGSNGVLEAIKSADYVPILDIVDMADIPDFDINKIGGIRSGINGLDKWISRFLFGSLNIITGINSSGKSTLLSQICVCEPLEQGYKTFMYSGELALGQLRSWVEFPLAGPNNIKEWDNGPNQPTGYSINKPIKDRMKEWYRGNIMFYAKEDVVTARNLLEKMQELVGRYGVKNFVIDNLMMIDLECASSELNRKQKEFVLDLKRFARKYNVVVHLVAHPRKLDIVKRLTKMDVAGSGDITNLADYVIAVHRVTRAEKKDGCEYDSLVDLFKNRSYGHQDKTIELFYDMKSKRMYGESDDLHKDYSWSKTEDGLIIEEVGEICPF